ncbi:MAG TPA: glyoxalase/bleomycin resistance/extradiol dioxygenase family protein [Kofleriaceae bacterium]
MSISINPYIIFDGTAEKAIAFYERALGIKAEQVSRFGDMPGGQIPEEHKQRVMHARIPFGNAALMVSDCQVGMQVPPGSNIHCSLQIDDLADARAKFDALAEGGQVEMPLQEMFWGATFGSLVDPFGVQWMINCETKKA